MKTLFVNSRTLRNLFLTIAILFSLTSTAAASQAAAPSAQEDSLMDEVMGVTNPVLSLPYKVPVLGNVMSAVTWPVKKTAGFVLSPFQQAAEWVAQDDVNKQLQEEHEKVVMDVAQEAARQKTVPVVVEPVDESGEVE